MKQNIFYTWDRREEREQVIGDIRDTLLESIGGTWRILTTPVILDNDLVDILLVNSEGQLCAVKVLVAEDTAASLGMILRDYLALARKLDKLQRAYASEYINTQAPLAVKIFMPQADEATLEMFTALTIPLEVYHYTFIRSASQTGLVIHKVELPLTPGGSRDYSSLMKVMGENVRSDSSQYEDSVLQVLERSEDASAEAPAAAETPPPTPPEDNIIEQGKLSEQELVEFFELENKLEAFK